MLSMKDEEMIRSKAKVENTGIDFVATYGDIEGHGDTAEEALYNLIVGHFYAEADEEK